MSQVVGHFGLGGRVPDYDECYGLYLNIPTKENCESFREFSVHTAAAPNGALPVEWLEAAVPNSMEASRWKNWDMRRGYSP